MVGGSPFHGAGGALLRGDTPVRGHPRLGVQGNTGQGWTGQFPHPILEHSCLPPLLHPLFCG